MRASERRRWMCATQQWCGRSLTSPRCTDTCVGIQTLPRAVRKQIDAQAAAAGSGSGGRGTGARLLERLVKVLHQGVAQGGKLLRKGLLVHGPQRVLDGAVEGVAQGAQAAAVPPGGRLGVRRHAAGAREVACASCRGLLPRRDPCGWAAGALREDQLLGCWSTTSSWRAC